MQDLRTERKEDCVNLVKDTILTNNQPHEDKNFIDNPLPSTTNLSIDFTHIQHGTEFPKNNSIFQGHCAKVENIEQAIAARNCIMQNPTLSVCDHLIYAYRIINQNSEIQSRFSDDLDIRGGKILCELLKQEEKTFICVTRLKNGPNIGPARFELIKNAAAEVLAMTPKPEEPSEYYLRLC